MKTNTVVDLSKADMFLGRNNRYYKWKWEGKPTFTVFKSWNLSGLIFGVLWMAFRKMYCEVAIISLAFLSVRIILLTYYHDNLALGVSVIINLLIAIFGNYLYMKKYTSESLKAHMFTDSDEYLKKKGDTNIWLPILLIVANFVVLYFIYMHRHLDLANINSIINSK